MAVQNPEVKNNDGAIWARLLGSGQRALRPEVARSILEMEFPPEDKVRLRELAAKARAGTLSPDEQDEVESYSRVGSILGVMKSKARAALRKAARAPKAGR
jgi:hypothetical protein